MYVEMKSKCSKLDEWYEVSLTSPKADVVFEDNMTLGFGETATWDMKELDGICDDICQPALDLLSQMDDVGVGNDNSKGPKVSTRYRAGSGAGGFW